MDELDIFAAIGGVDEDLLTEAPRRLPRRWGLIAAVLALAVLSACAAPAVIKSFTAVSGGSAKQTKEQTYQQYAVIINNGNDAAEAWVRIGTREMQPAEYQITLEVSGEYQRLDALEELYEPTWVPEDYVNFRDMSEENNRSLRYFTGDKDGIFGSYVIFSQQLLPEGNPVVFTDELSEFREVFVNDMTSAYRTYGKATVLELYPRLKEMDLPMTEKLLLEARRYLYWSDGAYLFRLVIPYEMDDETVTKIIDSVQIVEE